MSIDSKKDGPLRRLLRGFKPGDKLVRIPPKVAEAVLFLRSLFKDGKPRSSIEVEELARQQGVYKTNLMLAAQVVGIEKRKPGKCWQWTPGKPEDDFGLRCYFCASDGTGQVSQRLDGTPCNDDGSTMDADSDVTEPDKQAA
jgi:hypothetical protein